jgi:hypothetical protein
MRWLLLTLCLARLWIMPLPSSFWTDETGTAFVVERPADPSLLAPARLLYSSIYYTAPRVAQKLFGFSEISYRLPSILFMGIALWLIARIAARLIHPEAAWFAVFACLALPSLNYYAADARPYALGICLAAASIYCLIEWLDSSTWIFAGLFVVCAALLWRVHVVFWAFYPVFFIYALARRAPWRQALPVSLALALALTPVALDAIQLLHVASTHVVVPVPSIQVFRQTLLWEPVLICGVSALLLTKIARWRTEKTVPLRSAILIFSWWLWPPACLFVFSRATGTSLFVPRYFSLMLPGVALSATAAATLFIPAARWKHVTLALGIAALAINGRWTGLWPQHSPEDWRSASSFADLSADEPDTPVLAISPFVEAIPPVWSPDYGLPGFLYAPLFVYPVRGRIYPLPAQTSGEYALKLMAEVGFPRRRFILYGRDQELAPLMKSLAARPELGGWEVSANRFGSLIVVVFAKSL